MITLDQPFYEPISIINGTKERYKSTKLEDLEEKFVIMERDTTADGILEIYIYKTIYICIYIYISPMNNIRRESLRLNSISYINPLKKRSLYMCLCVYSYFFLRLGA